jgi:hypothetical protein
MMIFILLIHLSLACYFFDPQVSRSAVLNKLYHSKIINIQAGFFSVKFSFYLWILALMSVCWISLYISFISAYLDLDTLPENKGFHLI